MCNLGDYIEAKAIKKGMEIGRESVTVRIVRIQLEKKKEPRKKRRSYWIYH